MLVPHRISRRSAVVCGLGLPLLSLPAWAQDAERLASIAIEPNEGGAPVFQVTINGVAARAVLEFDMPAVAIARAFAETNGLTGKVELGLGASKTIVSPVFADFSGVKTAFGDQIHVVIGRPLLDRLTISLDAPGGRIDVLRPDAAVGVSATTEIFDVTINKGRAAIGISLEGGPTLQAGISYFNGGAVTLRETDTVRAWLSDGRPWSTAFAGSVANPNGIYPVFSLKSVALGRHVLDDVPARIEPLDGADASGPDVLLGPLVLNRFVVLLPGAARQVWLTPTATTFTQPIRRSLTGIYAIPAPGGLEVMHVGKDSPASRTELKAGDLIATIDGAQATRAAILGAAAGQVLQLRLATGATLKVEAARFF